MKQRISHVQVNSLWSEIVGFVVKINRITISNDKFLSFHFTLVPIKYTTTENGTCSKDCGDGVKVMTTVICQVSSSTSSSLDCKRSYVDIPCKIKDCPRKYFKYNERY